MSCGCYGHSGSGCPYHSSVGCNGHTSTGCYGHTIGPCTGHDGFTGGYYPCPTNTPTWTDSPLTETTLVKSIHINELRTEINAERVRRGYSTYDFGSTVTDTDLTDSGDVSVLRTVMDSAIPGLSWVWNTPTYVQMGELDRKEPTTETRTNLEGAMLECPCHCNYSCTCNCNYSCTCQCNYSCTCQCNYSCTCQCNYSCTCQCNYS